MLLGENLDFMVNLKIQENFFHKSPVPMMNWAQKIKCHISNCPLQSLSSSLSSSSSPIILSKADIDYHFILSSTAYYYVWSYCWLSCLQPVIFFLAIKRFNFVVMPHEWVLLIVLFAAIYFHLRNQKIEFCSNA